MLKYTLLFITALFFANPALAANNTDSSAEINRIHSLIKKVERSDVVFIRNGEEYSPEQAASHLRRKLYWAGDKVDTYDKFLEYIATKSYSSGKPYYVKTANANVMTAANWISTTL